MKINRINNGYKFGFKSIRTDKNQIATLRNGSMPILENKKQNILASLNRLANEHNRANIEFLFDVAENLNYGQKGNSEFKDIIDKETDAPENRENTDWSKLLADTIQQALSSADEDVSDLQQKFGEIFDTKQPLTGKQKEILELRNKFKQEIINEKSLEDDEALTQSANVSKNIDLFISSSEISLDQKKECLEKFLYLLSDDYKINPQLSDKKIQVIDEMLNDMLVKAPNKEELTTKGVNQLYSGICAAISICRKAVAYEDKSRYMDIVLEELKDADSMEVFDITELKSGKKVNIPKIDIDYDYAMSQGYRILDASAHLWMQNAHASGNGTIQSENYVAFDDNTYGVFDDSSWYEGFNPNLSDEKVLLKCLIKEQELLNSVLKTRNKNAMAGLQVNQAKKETFEMQSSINGEFDKTISEIFPDISNKETTDLIHKIIAFYKGSQPDNEMNISEKMPKEVKQDAVCEFIKKEMKISENDEKSSTIKNNSKKILELVEEYVSQDQKIKKLSNFNSKRSKYVKNRKLYQLAAAHRMAIESDVNLRSGVMRFEKISGLQTRDQQIFSYLNKLEQDLRNNNNEAIEHFAKGKSKEETSKNLLDDIIKIDSSIPKQIDDISVSLFDSDIKDQTKRLLLQVKEQIKFGNSDIGSVIAGISGIKNDKTQIINYLDKQIKKFDGEMSKNDLDEIIRTLGFSDRIELFQALFSQYLMALKSGISEEELERLIKKYGSTEKINTGISSQQDKLNSVIDEYNSILERWEVPSQRQLILEKMEKDNKILPYSKLDTLKERFNYIRSQISKNDSIENSKERQNANDKLYSFTEQELDIIASIEKSMPYIKKYCKTSYEKLNKELIKDLEQQYANIGMLNGQFWVREEGSSGLVSNEQIRIIEQMTGKPYHIEEDIEKAAKQIKQGDGGGIISYNVDDEGFSGHAQYVPSVTSETFVSGKDGKKETQDVVWTDNSWGRSEKNFFWNGRNGFNYTDYGSGYGWKTGFILADDMRIGQTVKALKDTTGYDSHYKEEYNVFNDIILAQNPQKTYQKLYKMFSYILSMKQGAEFYNQLEDALKNGKTISIKELEGVDKIIEDKTDALIKQIKDIKSREDYDKLPDNSLIKLVLNILSVYMETKNPDIADEVTSAKSMEELEDIKEDIMEDIISDFGAIICKTDGTLERIMIDTYDSINKVLDDLGKKFNLKSSEIERSNIVDNLFYNPDEANKVSGSITELQEYLHKQAEITGDKYFKNNEQKKFFIENIKQIIDKEIEDNIRIKDLNSPILAESPVKELFIAAVDKYLEPTSDREIIDIIAGLQRASFDEANVLIEALEEEDLGLNFKDPYEYVQKIRIYDSSVYKAFSEIVASYVIDEVLPKDSGSGNSMLVTTPEDFYRHLYIRLSEMDVQKYIKKYKAENFREYKVRPAFPEPVILADKEFEKTCTKMFEYFGNCLETIENSNYIIAVFDEYKKILSNGSTKSLSSLLKDGNDFVPKTQQQRQKLNQFISDLNNFNDLLDDDESIRIIKEYLEDFLNVLTENKDFISGKEAKEKFEKLKFAFDNWKASGITKEKFVQKRKEEINNIKENISILINTNILPKYRDDGIKRLNKVISVMSKSNDEEEIKYLQDEFIDFFINKHITKEPTKILSECVKMLQNGQGQTSEYSIMKNYLLQALKIAMQTKTQYKMVQNTHEGISSKTKEMLPLFSVTMTDGTKHSMNSEMGILYLIDQLENESDNHATLKLFLAQSGLSELALSALINNFNENSTREMIEDSYQDIVLDIKDFAELNELIDTFINQNGIKFTSLESAVNNLVKFIKRKASNPDNDAFKKYIDYLSSIEIRKELVNISQEMISPLLLSLSKNAAEYSASAINSQIEDLADISKIIENRFSLIELIEVPETSPQYKQREDFRIRYNELQDKISEHINDIRNMIDETQGMSSEIVED